MAYAATPKSSVTTVPATTPTKVPGTVAGGRLLLKLYNNDETYPIYYGDSAVDNTKGTPIPPGGESAWIPCSGDIYVYSIPGTTVRSMELS